MAKNITLNPDKDVVAAVREGLKASGGYCPCRLERTPDTKCMCKEFREQIADPDFEGFCHCLLYYKSKEPAAAETAETAAAPKEKEPIMSEITITKDNFEAEVLKSDIPVLLDFWAAWCGPCRMVAPVLAEIAQERAGQVKVGKVNVDDQPELAQAFRISSIPALFVMKDGKVTASAVGYRPKAQIEALL